MNGLVYPLKDIQQAFALMFLKISINDSKFECEAFNDIFATEFDQQMLNIAATKYLGLSQIKLTESKKLLNKLQEKIKIKAKVLEPPVNNCPICVFSSLETKEYKNIVCYSFDGPETREYSIQRCNSCTRSFSFCGYKNENKKLCVYDEKVFCQFF